MFVPLQCIRWNTWHRSTSPTGVWKTSSYKLQGRMAKICRRKIAVQPNSETGLDWPESIFRTDILLIMLGWSKQSECFFKDAFSIIFCTVFFGGRVDKSQPAARKSSQAALTPTRSVSSMTWNGHTLPSKMTSKHTPWCGDDHTKVATTMDVTPAIARPCGCYRLSLFDGSGWELMYLTCMCLNTYINI